MCMYIYIYKKVFPWKLLGFPVPRPNPNPSADSVIGIRHFQGINVGDKNVPSSIAFSKIQ